MPTPSFSGEHILASFDDALQTLRSNVLMMASLTERNLGNAFAGLFQRDSELANRVIVDDEEIDDLEKQVDGEGIDILLRFHPVARDLRAVIAAMKIGSNLERIADQATNVARRVRKLNETPQLAEVHLLEVMARDATTLVRDSLRAYADGDVELALQIKPRDRELDAQHLQVSEQITDQMAKNPDTLRAYLNLISIARYIERVGDHATNIAEDVVYAARAQDIRHAHPVARA